MANTKNFITLNNDVRMPALGLGVYQSSPEDTVGAVKAAIADGYRMIDTAAAYGNEAEVGQGIAQSGVDRSDLFVIAKLWISDYGYDSDAACVRPLNAQVGAGGDWTSIFCTGRCRMSSSARSAHGRRRKSCWPKAAPAPSACANFSPAHLDSLIARTEVVPALNQVELHPFFVQKTLTEAHASWASSPRPGRPSAASPLCGSGRAGTQDRCKSGDHRAGRKIRQDPAQIVLRWHIDYGFRPSPNRSGPPASPRTSTSSISR